MGRNTGLDPRHNVCTRRHRHPQVQIFSKVSIQWWYKVQILGYEMPVFVF